MDTKVAENTTAIKENTNAIGTINTKLTDQQNQISDNRNQITATNNNLNSQIGGLQGQINNTNSTVSNLSGAAEVVSNKSTSLNLGGANPSDRLYPSQKAAKSYIDQSISNIVPTGVPDATTLASGKIQLAGDLGGSATSPTVPGLTLKAPLASPIFTGTPALPTGTTGVTQTLGDNSTKLATTAYVVAEVSAGAADASSSIKGIVKLTGDLGGSATSPTVPGLALKAPLASPIFTGTPALPTGTTGVTQTSGDNSTKLATTAYVANAVSGNSGVPYSGATAAVNLGHFDLTVNDLTVGRGAGDINSNTAIGNRSLASNTTGVSNTANGYASLLANTTGDRNTANGMLSLGSNTTGSGNTANGYYSMIRNTTGSENTANGVQALQVNTTGNFNTANGFQSLTFNTTGNFNTANGNVSLFFNATGGYNTANGYASLYSNTTGSNNTANGHDALRNNQDGMYNTAIGKEAGLLNISGSNNTFIGYGATGSSTTISNEITLGNSSISNLRCQVTSITSLSDRRDKTEINPISEGLVFLKQLKPVIFIWNTRDKLKVGIKSAGFIAQDLLSLQQKSDIGDHLDLVSQNNPDKLEARYSNLLPIIVKAIQEESNQKDNEITILKIEDLNQKKVIQDLQKQIENQTKKLNQLTDLVNTIKQSSLK